MSLKESGELALGPLVLRRRKNRPRPMRIATAARTPMTMPAMAPLLNPRADSFDIKPEEEASAPLVAAA